MKRYSTFMIVASFTFFVGIVFVTVLTIRHAQLLSKTGSEFTEKNENQTEIPITSKIETLSEESPEAKAIRIAEEFIAENGYTDLPVNKNQLSYETVEVYNNLDELLESRANTLERKAYGILYEGSGTKMGQKGWTVAFQYKNLPDDFYKSLSREFGKKITKESHPLGRIITMDENFQNILVEHKDFPLLNVDKKL